jgi:O-antigen biosynthesis protein
VHAAWRAVRRQSFSFTAVPLQQLAPKPGAPNAWKSLGGNPIFGLQGTEPLPDGWVVLQIGLKATDAEFISPTLYADPGSGLEQQHRFLLRAPVEGRLKAVLHLPDSIAALRLDPMERPGEFELGTIRVRQIGRIEAWLYLTVRLLRRRFTSWRDTLNLVKMALELYARGGVRLLKERLIELEKSQYLGADYQDWIRRYSQLSSQERTLIGQRIETLGLRPKFSVIMPVYNTDLQWLRAAIESVRSQLYPDWELCISDDCSTRPGIREELQRYADLDDRIRVFFRGTNGHISANSNDALALASGDLIALLDADDLISEDALYWVAEELNAHPDTDLIYSDQDIIDVKERRSDPYFKPDWSPALILSQNYFCHLGVYRRSLVSKVGGFREGFEGSQDHDLVLRCAEATDSSRIRHIPRILYHWRSVPGSTASAEGLKAKPYAWNAGARAISEHLQRKSMAANVTRTCRIYYQVNYAPPQDAPLVSIIIPTKGDLNLLRPCLTSLFDRTTYPKFEVLIAINAAECGEPKRAAYLRQLEDAGKVRVLVYPDRPFNFAWTNNWAATQAAGSILCFMNDDIEIITPDWLEKFVARLRLDRVGAVGAMLYYRNNDIQHAGVILGLGGVAGHAFVGQPRGWTGGFGRAAIERDFSCVTGACMAVRREAFDEVEGFNEAFAIAFNDVDFCLRLRDRGWRIIWTPQVEHYHNESATAGPPESPQRMAQYKVEMALMKSRWGQKLDMDPSFNPNLSLYDHNMSRLAFPPRVATLSSLAQTQVGRTENAEGRSIGKREEGFEPVTPA